MLTLSPQHSRGKVLAEIRKVAGIARAAPLIPETTDPALSRLCFAELSAEFDANLLLSYLRELPGVETAETAAERGL